MSEFAKVKVTCPSCGWTGRRLEPEANWWRDREVPTCPKCAWHPVRYEKPRKPAAPAQSGSVPPTL